MKRGELVDRINPRVEDCTASCRDCDWHTAGAHQGYGNVQKRARHHVATTQHRVVVRKTCITIYRPIKAHA